MLRRHKSAMPVLHGVVVVMEEEEEVVQEVVVVVVVVEVWVLPIVLLQVRLGQATCSHRRQRRVAALPLVCTTRHDFWW